MYEKLEACPSCNFNQFTNFLICSDHVVSGESFALVKCNQCSLVFTNPRPNEHSLPSFYESDQYISHTSKSNSFINVIYKIVRHYTTYKKIQLIQSYKKQGSIIDFGCGTGHFISSMNKKEWKIVGFEPNEKARKLAISQGINVFEKIEELPYKVDVITAWHVIEHVSQLNHTLQQLGALLNNSGVMFIAVPNIECYDAEIYKSDWAAYDVPRHLYHFSQHSFTQLAKSHKLKIVATIPMRFDSYYVSMLSEKQKNGTSNLFKALRIGYLSNLKAKTTGQYSSQIYVLKK